MAKKTEKIDYYANGQKKVIDFIYGFFGSIILNVLLFFLFFSLPGVYNVQSNFVLISSLLLLLNIVMIVLSFNYKRKYLGIGIISAIFLIVLIPLLIFGACFLAFSGSRVF